MKIPVTPDYLHEVKNTWNDILKEQNRKWNTDKVLYARAEWRPEKKRQYAVLGKVKDWAVASLDGSLEPKEFWAPDFKVMITMCSTEQGCG